IMAVLFQSIAAELVAAARAESPSQPHTLIQHAALIVTIDPKLGNGPLGTIIDGDVLIAGDTIVAVGRDLSADASGAAVVDAAGKIVLPGFLDLHNHLVHPLIPPRLHHPNPN